MREGHASRTAEQNALFRALESSRPDSGRLFEDPLARSFLLWPLSLVRRLGLVPVLRRLVPCDFQRRDLESAMAAAGYGESARTFILWEGVTNYLTEPAVDATLRWCARASPGSSLLFTYVHRDILTRPDRFIGTKRLFAALEKAGERFTWGIEPEKLAGFLAERSLFLESDVGAAEYRERYFRDAARRMRGHEFYRVALARIGR